MSGSYPNQALNVIVFGTALTWLKANDVNGKKILVNGVISATKENKDAEIFIDDPMLISVIPKH